MASLAPGTLIAGRFEVTEHARRGGMSQVWRGVDQTNQEQVALKLLEVDQLDVERFMREARLLRDLSHPRIVRYVAHGLTTEGRPYLATEWLEGEDLARRLGRGKLGVDDSLTIARLTAEALMAAHAKGIVHRDIKPDNILLVEGDVARLKVLDFGLARPFQGARGITATGAIVGTVGYMSPEQVRGERSLDQRADLFSLGCLLYECLTGRVAFEGPHPMAVLAKLLLDEVPRVADLRADLPPEIDELVSLMMARTRERRPEDAASVIASLNELVGLGTEDDRAGRAPRIASREQRVVTALAFCWVVGESGCVPLDQRYRARELADGYQVTLTEIGSDAGVIVFRSEELGPETWMRASACALAMEERLDPLRIVIATDSAELHEQSCIGPAIDTATALLAAGRSPEIVLDSTTRSLVSRHFLLDGDRLLGRREAAAAGHEPHALLGRRKELRWIESSIEECERSASPAALMLTGAAGSGKTHLLDAIAASHRLDSRRILRVSCDRVEPRPPGEIARELLLAALEPDGAAAPGEPRETLSETDRPPALDTGVRIKNSELVLRLIWELDALCIDLLDEAKLEAALERRARLRDAFCGWLADLATSSSVLVLVDDLHACDALSLGLLESFLRTNARSIFFLLTARPIGREQFMGLRSISSVQEMKLHGLSRATTRRLVRRRVGDDPSDEAVERIVDLSGGNPWFVHELTQDASDELPPALLYWAQAQLDALTPHDRRLLRAASVFGEQFTTASIAFLLEDDTVSAGIARLLDRGLFIELSSFGSSGALLFASPLVRNAIHASWTDADLEAALERAELWRRRAPRDDNATAS